MRKMIIILCLLLTAALVFAEGVPENDNDGPVILHAGQLEHSSFLQELEKVELEGTLQFECPVPELAAGGKSYTLRVPGAMGFYRYVSEGDRIKVNGYILDGEKMRGPMEGFYGRPVQNLKALEGNPVVLVETAEFEGTTYQMPWVNHHGRPPFMMDEHRHHGREGFRGGFRHNEPLR